MGRIRFIPYIDPSSYGKPSYAQREEVAKQMAGDWMKIELDLSDKPEVHCIANGLKMDPDAVVGKLIRVWAWFDKHTADGNAVGVTYSLLDRITGITGFGKMMDAAGWMRQIDNVLQMPKFDLHTSASAKKRAETNKRVAAHRSVVRNADVTQKPLQKALPEKRREEHISRGAAKPNAALVAATAFNLFWIAYPRKKNKLAAIKAWNKLNPDQALQDRILRSLQSGMLAADASEAKHIPHASTWLNGHRWDDEPDLLQSKPQRVAL